MTAEPAPSSSINTIAQANVVLRTAVPAKPKPGTRRFFERGMHYVPADEDFRVEHERKKRIAPFEQHLKRFEYVAALDHALQTKRPVIICSLLDELAQRGQLIASLTNRDESALLPVLQFVSRYITHPFYSSILIDVANILLGSFPFSIEIFLFRLIFVPEKIQIFIRRVSDHHR